MTSQPDSGSDSGTRGDAASVPNNDLRAAAEWFDRNGRHLKLDVLSAHQSRGNGTTQWMTEDDREFRQDLRAALERLHAALSSPTPAWLPVEAQARIAELEKALAAISLEAAAANDVIRMNRDGGGQGRIRVATATHRIAALADKASQPLPPPPSLPANAPSD